MCRGCREGGGQKLGARNRGRYQTAASGASQRGTWTAAFRLPCPARAAAAILHALQPLTPPQYSLTCPAPPTSLLVVHLPPLASSQVFGFRNDTYWKDVGGLLLLLMAFLTSTLLLLRQGPAPGLPVPTKPAAPALASGLLALRLWFSEGRQWVIT